LKALHGDVQHVALVNPFAEKNDLLKVLPSCEEHSLKELSSCFQPVHLSTLSSETKDNEIRTEESDFVDARFPPPAKDRNGLLTHYLLDGASVLAARTLQVKPGHKILDLCAAPGGKSLVIAFDLFSQKPTPIDIESEDDYSSEGGDEEDDYESLSDEEKHKNDTRSRLNPPPQTQKPESQKGNFTSRFGLLVCNEFSESRRARLKRVMESYVPHLLGERKIQVTAQDATVPKFTKTGIDAIPSVLYDIVLVDAPCSSERHLVHNAQELLLWSRARSKANAVRQHALLSTALRLCEKGGRVIYSTCALSPLENDDLVSKFVGSGESSNSSSEKSAKRKHKATCRVLHVDFPIGEKTELGHLILPDTTGFGPMYISVLEKL